MFKILLRMNVIEILKYKNLFSQEEGIYVYVLPYLSDLKSVGFGTFLNKNYVRLPDFIGPIASVALDKSHSFMKLFIIKDGKSTRLNSSQDSISYTFVGLYNKLPNV